VSGGGGGGGAEMCVSVSGFGVCREGQDGDSVGEGPVERRRERSMLERRVVATVRRVGVGTDMTPRVRWRVVRGRIADG